MAEGSEPHLCKECKAQINERCECEICRPLTGIERRDKVFCHACLTLYSTVINSSYLSSIQNDWKRDQENRRKNMGLQ